MEQEHWGSQCIPVIVDITEHIVYQVTAGLYRQFLRDFLPVFVHIAPHRKSARLRIFGEPLSVAVSLGAPRP